MYPQPYDHPLFVACIFLVGLYLWYKLTPPDQPGDGSERTWW